MVAAATVGLLHMVQAGRPQQHSPQHTRGVAHIVQNPMTEEQYVMNMRCYYSDGIQMDAGLLLLNHCGCLSHMVVAFRDYLLYTDDLMAAHRLVPDHWVDYH